jgi:hypothetical protein
MKRSPGGENGKITLITNLVVLQDQSLLTILTLDLR